MNGIEIIQSYLKNLPETAGVYRMLDDNDNVLYVGKAKNLKARVSSYARGGGHSNRIAKMISITMKMEFVHTSTEKEALLLEANMIKLHKPMYNILLKDDKTYPYILIRRDHKFPQIVKHRGAKTIQGDYFGPFASTNAVKWVMDTLQKAFLLRSCTDHVFQNRSRPCLEYQIKRCSAPCVAKILKPDYDTLVDQAHDFLSGKTVEIHNMLQQKMQQSSNEMEFEKAATYRDRLVAIAAVMSNQNINTNAIDEADVIAATAQSGIVCMQIFFYRVGQNWGNNAHYLKIADDQTIEQALQTFILQFYENKPIPKNILISHEIEDMETVAELLSDLSGKKVQISHPKKGDKLTLVQKALENAGQSIARKLAEVSSHQKMLEAVQKLFDLANIPQRIEVYDNSHISGTDAIGAMIVVGSEGFLKKDYRKWTIKGFSVTEPTEVNKPSPQNQPFTTSDDYAMMKEVLTRRFTRLLKEQESGTHKTPDLILVDGGQGQLSVALEVRKQFNLHHIPIIGIAKGEDRDAGRERFFTENKPSFLLLPKDPVLYFLQRIRDEAHRFAIGTHQQKRQAKQFKSDLDDIEGIGANRKHKLLRHFGSAKAIASAAYEDLAKVEGISKTIAKKIYDYFH